MVTAIYPGLPPITISSRALDFRLDKFTAGKGYRFSPGNVSPGAAGNVVKARIRNLAVNTKTAYITKLIIASTVSQTIRLGGVQNPDPGDYASFNSQTPYSMNGSAVVSQLKTEWDVADAALATTVFDLLIFPANTSQELPATWVLPPNSALDLQFSDTATTTVNRWLYEWYEE